MNSGKNLLTSNFTGKNMTFQIRLLWDHSQGIINMKKNTIIRIWPQIRVKIKRDMLNIIMINGRNTI